MRRDGPRNTRQAESHGALGAIITAASRTSRLVYLAESRSCRDDWPPAGLLVIMLVESHGCHRRS